MGLAWSGGIGTSAHRPLLLLVQTWLPTLTMSCRSSGRLQSVPQARDEVFLLGRSGHLHALEVVAESDVDVEVAGILVKVQERARAPREVAALALAQLRQLPKLGQQFL